MKEKKTMSMIMAESVDQNENSYKIQEKINVRQFRPNYDEI